MNARRDRLWLRSDSGARSSVRRGAVAAVGVALAAVLVGCGTGTGTGADPETESKADGPAGVGIESCAALPDGFVYLNEVDDSIDVELKYAGTDNFTGAVVDGYESANAAVMRGDAAQALARVQASVAAEGLELLVYDAFRPTRAVADFVAWSTTDDESTKEEFYPAFDKPDLFELGYIAEQSGHSLGGTVDVTLVDVETGEPLDMGGSYDLFDERSHYDADGITETQFAHRTVLRDAMLMEGFEPYPQEWWHFTLPVPEDAERLDFALAPCD